jgi:hypothetical protein
MLYPFYPRETNLGLNLTSAPLWLVEEGINSNPTTRFWTPAIERVSSETNNKSQPSYYVLNSMQQSPSLEVIVVCLSSSFMLPEGSLPCSQERAVDWASWRFRAMREKWKLSSDVGDSGSKKCKRGYGGAYGGVRRSLRLAGVWSQVVGFIPVNFDGSYAVATFLNIISSPILKEAVSTVFTDNV